MAHIKVDFDGLQQQTSRLRAETQSYEGLNQRMKNITEQIRTGWEGNAATAYAEVLGKYQAQTEKMVGGLQEFIKYAERVTNGLSDADRECASKIRGSF